MTEEGQVEAATSATTKTPNETIAILTEKIKKLEESQERERKVVMPNRVELIQINTKPEIAPAKYGKKHELIANAKVVTPGKKYYCMTGREKQIFKDNHPDEEIEAFNIELPGYLADKYLNEPENKRQFARKEQDDRGSRTSRGHWNRNSDNRNPR